MATRKRRPSLKPRKQPCQARSSETVNIILEAAARILETRGFAGYTTNAVAERAGVSIGSLYQYFPNKDALTAALIDRETVPFVSALAGAAQAKNCLTGFDRLIEAAVAHQMRRPELARLLDFEERRLPLSHRDLRVADHITDLVAALFKHDDAPVVTDLALATADVMAIVKGMVDAAGERGERDADALACRVRKAVCGYLCA
jgi:AcrR family transcriptional regulator